jgi:hypothetical protein
MTGERRVGGIIDAPDLLLHAVAHEHAITRPILHWFGCGVGVSQAHGFTAGDGNFCLLVKNANCY